MKIISFVKKQLEQIKNGGIRIFYKKLYKVIEYTAILSFGGLILILCKGIKPIKYIRFGRLYTSRIGHLCSNMDNYIFIRADRKSNEIGFFLPDKFISNQSILKKWREVDGIFIGRIALGPVLFLELFAPKSRLLISFSDEMGPLFSETSSSPSNIKMNDENEENFQKISTQYGLKKPYVCFHNRDSAYLKYWGLNLIDPNDHDYRDFDFDDYRMGAEELTRRGIQSVRVGDKVAVESKIDTSHLISFTGSNSYDLDLIENSIFFVGTNSGMSCVSRILRKPELLINYIPFEVNRLSMYACNSIIVPKKLYKIAESRYLTFSEINSILYNIHYQGNFYQDMGIRIENNTEEEIKNAIIEMHAWVTGKWSDSPIQEELQNKFWDSFEINKIIKKTRKNLGIKISSTYLEKNPHLI